MKKTKKPIKKGSAEGNENAIKNLEVLLKIIEKNENKNGGLKC